MQIACDAYSMCCGSVGGVSICERCRREISNGTKLGLARARKRGVRVGRPKAVIAESVLRDVLSGRLTTQQAAELCGVSAMTIRRRLRGERA